VIKLPFVQEYLECKKTEIHKDNNGSRMNCPIPTKIRLRWVHGGSWDEMEINTDNWRMIRPSYCCVQPDMFE
jgi:hypothetical protein